MRLVNGGSRPNNYLITPEFRRNYRSKARERSARLCHFSRADPIGFTHILRIEHFLILPHKGGHLIKQFT